MFIHPDDHAPLSGADANRSAVVTAKRTLDHLVGKRE
jgi:hypothetical protein